VEDVKRSPSLLTQTEKTNEKCILFLKTLTAANDLLHESLYKRLCDL
jgi:hypothetical protein